MNLSAAEPYIEPADTNSFPAAEWQAITGPLSMQWVTKDAHFRQRKAPQRLSGITDTTVTAWRGERIGLEALIVATKEEGPLSVRLSSLSRGGKKYGAPGSGAAFMRYVITTAYNTCGYPSDTIPTFTLADMIDLPDARVTMEPMTVRPVWVSVEVPSNLPAGLYTAKVDLMKDGVKKPLKTLTLNVEVADRSLPAPKDYAFYLDFWQQPYAISRYYGVKPWSDEHLRLLEPYADMLARAGQKTVSTILFYEPWGEQSNDKFEPMVETVLLPDSTWQFDYTIFDRYVEWMASRGIDANISCFTMIPWDMNFRYFDKGAGEYRYLKTTTSSREYKQLWTAFLKGLADHTRAKGWFDKTMIVMDERGLPDMLNAYAVAKEAVPDFKMSLAGNYHRELVDSLDSYTVIKGDWFPADVLGRRRDRGFISLLYTCCATPAPNIFSNNAPADGAYLPVYATATGFDGYLHWSFTNWTDHPLTDTRFRMFAPGDTYVVYPDGRSSLRYERMLEGIQMSEKIRLLRAELEAAKDAEGLEMLEQALLPVRTGAMSAYYPTSQVVRDLQMAIERLGRRH